MADVSASGKILDVRAAKIRLRRMEHEIYSMKGTLGKYDIDILEAEASIERIHESIATTNVRIKDKEAELAEQTTALEENK